MPSVKVRATTPPAFRLCSSLSKRALDFNTSRYERTKLKLTLLWDCVVSFILLSKKCLFSYLDHQPCFKLLARKPVPHFGDSRSAFSLCSSQLNGERCAVTYSHAISNLTPPVSSSMAQLFGDSDPLKQHRRIFHVLLRVHVRPVFLLCADLWMATTGRCRELCQQLQTMHWQLQLRMYQSSQSQHPNPSTTCISQPKLVSAIVQISPVSFSQYAKPGSVASAHRVPLDHTCSETYLC